MVIAIDGPAGAGKSTVARLVAEALGFRLLDTGAMYRAAALCALRDGDPATAVIDLGEDGAVLLDGEDVSAVIRTAEVTEEASRLAAEPNARATLTDKQRTVLAEGEWVAEGRDIGTVVAPAAEVKVFLVADPRERARRRADEAGRSLEEVLAEQIRRDERDATRAVAPLVAADDAVELDTTDLEIDDVVARIVELARGADPRH